MVEQVREGYARKGNAEVVHVGEVGLAQPTGWMDLLKDDLTGRPSLGAPERNVALKCAQLDRLVAARVAQTQFIEERLDLQGWVTLQLGLNPGPILRKRIGARASAGLLELTGKLSQAFIFAGSAHAHTSTSGGLFLGFAFVAFVSHTSNLVVGFHDASFWASWYRLGRPTWREAIGSFDDRHRQ